jgi:hypothetical protein
MENKFVDKCGFDLVLYPSEPDKLETASGALCSTIKEAVGMGWLDKAVINAKSFQDAERHTSEHWNGMFESAATRIGDQPRQHVELSATDTASKIFFDTVLWGMMHGYKKPEEEGESTRTLRPWTILIADLLSTSALSHPGRALSRLFDLTMEFAREEHLVPGAIISECAQGGATAVESMADKVNRVIVSVAKEGMARGILSPTLLSEKSHEGFVQDNLRAGQDTVNALKKLESMQGRTGSEAP